MPEILNKQRVVVVCGPTGIGKTTLSIHLAEHFGGEIVGADSMQIYRHMDIGTAKPTPAERARIPHHMIDTADPDDAYDAARYSAEARQCIDQIHDRGKLPFVVGGTGLYIRALLHGLCDAQPADPIIRERLRAKASDDGGKALYDRLKACDPSTARRIHPNDTYRIIRSLEIFEVTGKPMSAYQHRHQFAENPFHVLKIGLHMDREALYERIDFRVEQMITDGLLFEVSRLLQMGYGPDLKPMQSLGYRHMVDYISNNIEWEEAVRTMKRDTRRYAKRQLTWFRADGAIQWHGLWQEDAVSSLIRTWMAPNP